MRISNITICHGPFKMGFNVRYVILKNWGLVTY